MTAVPSLWTKILLVLRRLAILVLAGLLVFHHSLMLFELYLQAGGRPLTFFDHVQSICRFFITLSLLLVVFGVRRALWGMWISIGALVATQYWAHLGELPVGFTEGRHVLSYLKGFIFPTIITLAFPSRRRQSTVAQPQSSDRPL